ncbi:MAG: AAA family ATPase [Sphaerochaetaceae bacterium]
MKDLILKRKIESNLVSWYNSKSFKPALLVAGARQVGKTTSIRSFGKKYYQSVIEINFEAKPSLKEIFAGDLDVDTLLEKISVAGVGRLIPHKTLIFLDEIQSCPQARTATKFLVEDGRYDVISSGSLLGINYRDVSSFPVGFEYKIEMHSLDFEEFLWANGIEEETIANLHTAFIEKKAVDSFIHNRIMDLFRRYMIVGGMPAVVRQYITDKNIEFVMRQQRAIVQSYRDDISKYAGKRKGEAKLVFDSIPAQLMEKNKKFKLVSVEESARFRVYEEALMWLYDANIASFCFNVTSAELPFELNEKRNTFKFFLRDTGLLSLMSLGNVQREILSDNLKINEGSIVENAVADLLIKRGHKLHYYDVKGRLEVDFLIANNNQVLPVEAKSGSDFKIHSSLNSLLSKFNKIKRAVVLHKYNSEYVGAIEYLPLYMVMFL